MDVRIVDYGENADGGFISYNISGLSQNQLEFLNNNLDDETQITNDNLILKTKFGFVEILIFIEFGLIDKCYRLCF